MRRIRIIIASLLLSGVALAEPIERGDFRMVWHAPADCPTNLEALARIEALLGARVSELELVPLAARGRITTVAPGHFELVLETFQGEQRFIRSMQAGSCAELTDAGALVVALAIDPTLSERPVGASPVTVAPTPAPTASTPAPRATAPAPASPQPTPRARPPEPKPKPHPARPARFLIGARAVLDLGSIADVAVGPGLAVGVQWRALEVSLEGLWLPERRSLVEPGKGGDISLTATSLRGCFRPLTGALQALGCATFELGSLDGNAVGTIVRTHQNGLWAAPGALLAGRLRLGDRLLFSLGAGALVPIQPIDFTLFNVGVVRRVPPLVGRGEAGLYAHFD